MVRYLIPALFLLLSVTTGIHCRRSKETPITTLTGKLVVVGACEHFVVQVLAGSIPDSSVLVKSWTNTMTDSTYTNVFAVSDACYFAAANLSAGDIFTFTLNGTAAPETCTLCDVASFPDPSVHNVVTNIQKVQTNPQ